jgi:hypothetical protein
MVASKDFGYQKLPVLMLAKDGKIMIKDTKLMTWQTSQNQTTPSGYTFPGVLDMHYQNGSDTVQISLSNPKVVHDSSPVDKVNATVVGNPHYMRLEVDAKMIVNVGGENATLEGPAVYEILYAQ